MVEVIKTGSTGNAVLYFNKILVDCGTPFKVLKPYLSKIQLILLTHEHGDHFNLSTLKNIQLERPGVRIAGGLHMKELCKDLRNFDVLQVGKNHNYGLFSVCPIQLYHDVQNFGYRIFNNNNEKKAFHATDTAHLDGITAFGYDFYCIEHNYDAETIQDKINSIEQKGGYAYQRGAINSHLSEQQANDWLYKNATAKSKIIRLHESKNI